MPNVNGEKFPYTAKGKKDAKKKKMAMSMLKKKSSMKKMGKKK
jgi:hypothetical protein